MTNYITLSTGRRFYAYRGIVSLAWPPDDPEKTTLFYGYDGEVDEAASDGPPAFTPEERKEIAEHMAARWREWGGLSEDAPSAPHPGTNAPGTIDMAPGAVNVLGGNPSVINVVCGCGLRWYDAALLKMHQCPGRRG